MKHLITLFLIIGLVYNTNGQPLPCNADPQMTPTCDQACVICDIDGFSGRNRDGSTDSGVGFNNFCSQNFQNIAYIAFIAGSTDLTIEVNVSNCLTNTGAIGGGLQVGIFESNNCQEFIGVSNCDSNIPNNTSEIFSNTTPLIIGQYYYLVMDGRNGSVCDWTFNVLSGSTQVAPLSTSGTIDHPEETCSNHPTPFITSGQGGATLFYWTIDGEVQSDNSQSTSLSFPNEGNYQVCVIAANACDEAPESCTLIKVRNIGTLNIEETLCDGECIEYNNTQFCNTGFYTELVVQPSGCDSTININLQVLPQAESFVDIFLCQGASFFIGNTPYNTSGSYQNTVQTSLACDSIVNLELLVIQCEIVSTSSSTPTICHGEATGQITFAINQGTPPFSYSWNKLSENGIQGNGNTNLFTGNTIDNLSAGMYQIYVEDMFGNDVAFFETVDQPSTMEVEFTLSDFNGFNISCQFGFDGIIEVFPSGGIPNYSYLWNNGQFSQELRNVPAGNYEVTITDSYGCQLIENVILDEPQAMTSYASFIDPTCQGSFTGQIIVDSIIGGVEPYQYSLVNGDFDFNPNFSELGSDVYMVYVLDANNCTANTVGILQAPQIPNIGFEDNLFIELGEEIIITPNINDIDIDQIIWTPDISLDCTNCLEPTANPLTTQGYTLSVSSIDGCIDTAIVVVFVEEKYDVYIPNIFSPNGDGFNDIFSIGAGPEAVIINLLEVYDRWGNRMFTITDIPPNDPTIGWDGTFQNKRLNPGVYAYHLKVSFINGVTKSYSGSINANF